MQVYRLLFDSNAMQNKIVLFIENSRPRSKVRIPGAAK